MPWGLTRLALQAARRILRLRHATDPDDANDDDDDDDDDKGRRRWGARRAKFFQNLVRVDAVDFGKKSSKSELSSRFFGRLKILQDLEGQHETCEVPIWKSCEFLSVTSRFVSKSYPRCPKIQISAIFGGGVNKSISIFFLTFGQNWLALFWVCWYDDMMLWWYDDTMIWWYDDMMTWWYDAMMI